MSYGLKPLDERLPPKVLESVMSILVSVQWDVWRFMLPAKPLLKLDVAVVSHGHLDHWHQNFWQKDVVLKPWGTPVPNAFAGLKNIYGVQGSTSIGRLKFACLGGRDVVRYLGLPSREFALHAFWWVVKDQGTGVEVLFIGDLRLEDVAVANEFVEVLRMERPLQGVLLPSFGGVSGHGCMNHTEASQAVKQLAKELLAYNTVVCALPHPVNADWADFNALRT